MSSLSLLLGMAAVLLTGALNGTPAQELSESGSANCYLISTPGTWSFRTVKGTSDEVLADVKSAEVLWESFGTAEVPEVGAIISEVSCADNRVVFSTPETLKNGNAVIAVRDELNQISWSWHIWVCEGYDAVASGQVYYNNAGTLMDRNLGATTATPCEDGVGGLMYQWGRKDPFLGAKTYKPVSAPASSTLAWPAPVATDAEHGTVEYAVKNPTTFITADSANERDWLFPDRDNTLWKESEKTIFDPCPVGWKVPAGGADGVWATAAGEDEIKWPSEVAKYVVNLSTKLGDADNIYYPIAAFIAPETGIIASSGLGCYFTSTSYDNRVAEFYIYLNSESTVYPKSTTDRAYGYSVRCAKE